MKTIEYWHPKRGIGGPALEDSDHAFLYETRRTTMTPVMAVVKKHNEKDDIWTVRPLTPTAVSMFYLHSEDFDYDDIAVNDLVDVYQPEGEYAYRARRHGAKAQ